MTVISSLNITFGDSFWSYHDNHHLPITHYRKELYNSHKKKHVVMR